MLRTKFHDFEGFLPYMGRSLCGVVVKPLAFQSRGREFDPGLLQSLR